MSMLISDLRNIELPMFLLLSFSAVLMWLLVPVSRYKDLFGDPVSLGVTFSSCCITLSPVT